MLSKKSVWFRRKITYYRRKTITSSFSLSKISSTSLLAFPNLARIQNKSTQISTKKVWLGNEVPLLPYPGPVLSFFKTLYVRIGAFNIAHFTKMRTKKLYTLRIILPCYFMLLELLLSYYARKLSYKLNIYLFDFLTPNFLA
ncbi:hypothetical protein AMTRI_Chr04g180380 [Amborella trichopoda]